MKNIMRVWLFSVAFVFVLAACNNDKKEDDSSKEVTEQKEHATHDDNTEEHDQGYEMAMAVYQCPMKCEEDKTYTEEGACPVCKMDLKELEVASNDESKEEEGVE